MMLPMTWIGATKFEDVFPFIFLGILVVIAIAWGAFKARELFRPTRVGPRLRRFFGGDFEKVQAHLKTFPGYDLASISRALASFWADCCHGGGGGGGGGAEALGSLGPGVNNVQALLVTDEHAYVTKQRPGPLSYERLPVDVDVEESFVSDCLYLARVRADVIGSTGSSSAAAAGDEPIAVLLATNHVSMDYDEDMETHSAAVGMINLSIACRSKAVADFFFTEIEERRQRLSVYRGKVIDPVVNNSGIQTIAFRRITPVSEKDLVLPEKVKELIHGSIVAFYEHQAALSELGVELKRGVLFHSPPGTGKTSISLYLAALLPNFTVCFISGKRLLHPREMCRMGRYLQPAMLVFEDIDLIAQERDHNGLATVLGELMNQIDGCEPKERVLFIMNTNSMDRIEQAVRNRPGRVDQIVHVPLPNAAERVKLLRLFAQRFSPDEGELVRVAEATEGATPATLKEIVKRAAVMAIARDGRTNGEGVRIRAEDLLLAYEQVHYLREVKRAEAEVL